MKNLEPSTRKQVKFQFYDPKEINVSYLYSIICLISAGTANNKGELYYFTVVLFLALLGKVSSKSLAAKPVKGLVAGILLYLHAVFHGWAVSLTKVVYMISVKRLSILIGVFFGGLFFSEENIPIRAAGTLLMLAGAVIIMIIGY